MMGNAAKEGPVEDDLSDENDSFPINERRAYQLLDLDTLLFRSGAIERAGEATHRRRDTRHRP
jgi:hypothetical protein